jgi:hypothetical protein
MVDGLVVCTERKKEIFLKACKAPLEQSITMGGCPPNYTTHPPGDNV